MRQRTLGIHASLRRAIIICAIVFPLASFACDKHPGVPHDAWMAWVNDLNAKTEAAKQQQAASAKAVEEKKPMPDGDRPVGRRGEASTAAPRASEPARERPLNPSPFRSMDEIGR